MDARCILHTEAAGRSLYSRSMNAPPAAQRNRNLSHGGNLSRPTTPRRSLRSSSARTASDQSIQHSSTHTPRIPSAMLLAPLSQRPHVFASCRRRRGGSVTSTSFANTLETEHQTRKDPPKKQTHVRRTHAHHLDSSGRAQARSCASLLLWYAQQSIKYATTTTGSIRTPFVMDVVLDLRVEYDDDTLIELLQRRRQDVGSLHTQAVYSFVDDHNLDRYWTDQAAIWGGMRTIDEGSSRRFPESDERSTAPWTAALNGGLSED